MSSQISNSKVGIFKNLLKFSENKYKILVIPYDDYEPVILIHDPILSELVLCRI